MTEAPAVVALLVLTGAIYARGAARLTRPAWPERHGRRLRRSVAFYGGLAVLAGALISPLDAHTSRSFSAHMVQHLLLMLVAAPLLAYARPGAALVAGLPTEGRSVVRRVSTGNVRGAAHLVANPLVVGAVGALVLWAWHMPALYELALSYDAVHAAEHLTFIGTALLFWAVVLDSGRRRGVGRPVALALVSVTGVQSTALGAVLLFASTPLYPGRTTGLDDQQLAGALMWGPPALLYVVTMAWLLVRWFAEMDEASDAGLPIAMGQPL